MIELAAADCQHNDDSKTPLDDELAKKYLSEQLPHWSFADGAVTRKFKFKNFYHTMNFVNALAWIANREAHHPDMQVSYGHCTVTFTTHDMGNQLGINDLICAAKTDALVTSGNFGPKLVEG